MSKRAVDSINFFVDRCFFGVWMGLNVGGDALRLSGFPGVLENGPKVGAFCLLRLKFVSLSFPAMVLPLLPFWPPTGSLFPEPRESSPWAFLSPTGSVATDRPDWLSFSVN